MIIAADLDSRVGTLENKVTHSDIRFERVMAKLDNFVEESRAARERQDANLREMREKHDADMRRINEKHDADMREINEKHNADMREMREDMRNLRSDLNNLGNYFRTTNITVIVGIAALVIAVLLK